MTNPALVAAGVSSDRLLVLEEAAFARFSEAGAAVADGLAGEVERGLTRKRLPVLRSAGDLAMAGLVRQLVAVGRRLLEDAAAETMAALKVECGLVEDGLGEGYGGLVDEVLTVVDAGTFVREAADDMERLLTAEGELLAGALAGKLEAAVARQMAADVVVKSLTRDVAALVTDGKAFVRGAEFEMVNAIRFEVIGALDVLADAR